MNPHEFNIYGGVCASAHVDRLPWYVVRSIASTDSPFFYQLEQVREKLSLGERVKDRRNLWIDLSYQVHGPGFVRGTLL